MAKSKSEESVTEAPSAPAATSPAEQLLADLVQAGVLPVEWHRKAVEALGL
jgi:hypothetical protein